MGGFWADIDVVFRCAVREMPYRSISVKGLCDRAGVTRKAFYQRFDGKQDVLHAIFFNNVVLPELELCRLLTFGKMRGRAADMERHMFKAVLADGDFYRALVTSTREGSEAFSQAARKAFITFNAEMLRESGFRESQLAADYVASYFADAKAQMMRRWIEDGFAIPADEIADLCSRLASSFWKGFGK